MRLKSMTLLGFKSFPDKTVLTFDPGVTAVVGPNGSGKSNISDAMRWVLGEISSKNIRGTKMEDVIFGGTGSRRPMGYTEVSLTIDNTDPDNRMNIDYDEVTVTRRYYRTGESEYQINHNPVRLRDITELFMNTGIGRSGYSIVGQGKVADIISQKSDERRSVFEEAAGIAKYRHKKNEAERRLAEVDDNLVRISDILGELEGRVGPLEKESVKAKKYLEFFEAKKEADISIWLFDTENVRSRGEKLDGEYAVASHELEMADDDLKANETKTEKLYSDMSDKKNRFEEIVAESQKLNEEKYRLEGTGKVHENDIGHITEQIQALTLEQTIASQQLADTDRRHEEKTAELKAHRAELKASDERLAALDERISAFDRDISAIEEQLIAAEEKAAAAADALTEARIALSSHTARGLSGDEKRSSLGDEIASEEAEISALNEKIKKAQAVCDGYEKKIAETKDALNAALTDEADLTDKKNEASDELSLLEIDIAAKEQNVETLRRMEEHFEGYSQSIRSVISASEHGQLNGICGPVSRLITVSPSNSVAVETALGANIQNIVTEDDRAAKNAIKYLKEIRGGRATFYPLSTIKVQYLEEPLNKISKHPGYIGLASELVTCDDKFRPAVDFLLARTLVFDNIDHATEAARAFDFRLRISTSDGQLVNPGGSLTGGSLKRDSGILTRSSEISGIESEIGRKKQRRDKLSDTIDKINAELQSAEQKRMELTGQTGIISSLLNASQKERDIAAASRDAAASRRDSLLLALSSLDTEGEEYKRISAELESDIAACEKENEEAKKAVTALTDRRAEVTSSQSDVQTERSGLLVSRAGLVRDVASCDDALDLIFESQGALSFKIEQKKNEIIKKNEALTRLRSQIDTERESTGVIEEKLRALTLETEELKAQNSGFDEKLRVLREENHTLTRHREAMFRQTTKLEAQRSQLAGEQETIVSRLWEDYELTFSAAAALGYAPLTEETRKTTAARQTEMKNKLRALGPVNVNAIEEYKEVSERYTFMKTQYEDLTTSKKDLTGIIYDLESEMREKFASVMEEINHNFKKVFRELFGGGSAELSFDNPDDLLTSGIIINVAPPGKIIKNLSLLSGGEQAFVAIALFFAILRVNPTPFCVLDEIEAALDEVNVTRFAEYAKSLSDKTQFIIITHRRGTMETADSLYGVTMAEKGVSTVLSVNINDVEKKIGVKL